MKDTIRKGGKIFLQKWKEEKGMGTIEIVIIVAVLVGLAFLFHAFVTGFFDDVVNGIKNKTKVDDLFTLIDWLWIM